MRTIWQKFKNWIIIPGISITCLILFFVGESILTIIGIFIAIKKRIIPNPE